MFGNRHQLVKHFPVCIYLLSTLKVQFYHRTLGTKAELVSPEEYYEIDST